MLLVFVLVDRWTVQAWPEWVLSLVTMFSKDSCANVWHQTCHILVIHGQGAQSIHFCLLHLQGGEESPSHTFQMYRFSFRYQLCAVTPCFREVGICPSSGFADSPSDAALSTDQGFLFGSAIDQCGWFQLFYWHCKIYHVITLLMRPRAFESPLSSDWEWLPDWQLFPVNPSCHHLSRKLFDATQVSAVPPAPKAWSSFHVFR